MLADATNLLIGQTATWAALSATGVLWANTSFRTGPTAGTPVYWNSTITSCNGPLWSGWTGYESGNYGTARYATWTQQPDWAVAKACIASWNAYEMFKPKYGNLTMNSTIWETGNVNQSSGSGNVYPTLDYSARASRDSRPTRTHRADTTITSSRISANYSIPISGPAQPSCDYPRACSLLYVSYLSSLGLPESADIPSITPPPRNSPTCGSDFYYTPSYHFNASAHPRSPAPPGYPNTPTFSDHPRTLSSAASINVPKQSTWSSPYWVPSPFELTPAGTPTPHGGPQTLQPVALPDRPVQPPTVTWPATLSAVTKLDGVPMAPDQLYFVVVPYSTLERTQGSPLVTDAPALATAMDIVVGARFTLTADGVGHTVSAVGGGSILVDGHSLVDGNAVLEIIEPGEMSVPAGNTSQDAHDAAAAMLEPGSVDRTVEEGDRLLVEGEIMGKETTLAIIGAVFDDGDTLGAVSPYGIVRASASTSAFARMTSAASITRAKPISVPRPTATTTTSEGSIHDETRLLALCYVLVAAFLYVV